MLQQNKTQDRRRAVTLCWDSVLKAPTQTIDSKEVPPDTLTDTIGWMTAFRFVPGGQNYHLSYSN